jgi:hypothetical protein
MIIYNPEHLTCLIHVPKNSSKYLMSSVHNQHKVIFKTFGWYPFPKGTIDISHLPFKYIETCLNSATYTTAPTVHNKKNPWFRGSSFYTAYAKTNKIKINYADIKEVIAYLRDPYDRLISAWNYRYAVRGVKITPRIKRENKCSFEKFIKRKLVDINFNDKHPISLTHIYPQHKFVVNKQGEIDPLVKLYRLEDHEHGPLKLRNFKLRKYDLDKHYDAESREIVETVYKKDFELIERIKVK